MIQTVLNILLAEDNAGDVFLVRRALKAHKIPHRFAFVRDGAEALEFIARMGRGGEQPCPDIVLLDLNLLKVDWPHVLGEFRKHPDCSDTPVIVITSSDAKKDRARMEELGVARYFRKPSNYRAFLQLGAIVRDVAEGIANAPVSVARTALEPVPNGLQPPFRLGLKLIDSIGHDGFRPALARDRNGQGASRLGNRRTEAERKDAGTRQHGVRGSE